MKPSHLRHPLAVLRRVIGSMGQKELASLVEKSTVTIQKIENEELRLSEALAQRIANETGVSIGWLLEGNPKAPPVTDNGQPFTRAVYEETRSGNVIPPFGAHATEALFTFSESFSKTTKQILLSAMVNGKLQLAIFKFTQTLAELSREFGIHESGEPTPAGIPTSKNIKKHVAAVAKKRTAEFIKKNPNYQGQR